MGNMIKLASQFERNKTIGKSILNTSINGMLGGAVVGGIAGTGRQLYRNIRYPHNKETLSRGFAEGSATGSMIGALGGAAYGTHENWGSIKPQIKYRK